jgi:hypothetical protein
LFFTDRTRNFGSLSEEIKVLAYRLPVGSRGIITPKGIIIKHIIRLIQLVT